ncbi:unnamed protein product [Phytophthora fragariaefolia]|uniref:Unnamed protein product n=1 Tax=Phytophthora fragariaefolia TaxID=1490495 RepID=A0A9W7D414_9STRA|nr:unnamed protein product [Phytophthora fragariaefolia]
MSLGEYKKVRSKAIFARDELQDLFDAGSDADMEGSEEDEETSSSRRDEPGGYRVVLVRTAQMLRGRSARAAAAIDRSLTQGRCPVRGVEATPPSGVEASRTSAVRDPSMPTPRTMESRFDNTAPPSQYALYSCSDIKDDDVTVEKRYFLRLTRMDPDRAIGS